MISLWWSFALTTIGVTGLVLVYRSQSLLGPGIGLAVQALWIAYAVTTQQWWFLLSAVTYGAANVYGIAKRRRAADPELLHNEPPDDAPADQLWVAEERLRRSREALVATGYFTPDQVGDDVAPRITELNSHYTPGDEPARP